MRIQLAKTFCAVGAFSLLCVQALPQENVVAKVLKNEVPSSMTLTQMQSDWKAVRLGVSQGTGGSIMDSFMSMMSGMMGALGGGGGESAGMGDMMAMGAMMIFGITWTKGETIKSGDQEFLITYKIDLDQFLIEGDTEAEPDFAKMPLRLNLINLKSINTIAPLPELTKEKFIELLQGGPGGGTPDMPMTSPTTPEEQPATVGDAQMAAKRTATLSNIKQVSLGMIMYTADYDDVLPYAQSTTTVKYVTMPYLKNTNVWKTENPEGGQIVFNMGVSGLNYSQIDSPAEVVLFYESKAWPDGRRAVAFTDGHCKFLTEQDFQAAMKRSKITLPRAAKPLPADYGVKEMREMGNP